MRQNSLCLCDLFSIVDTTQVTYFHMKASYDCVGQNSQTDTYIHTESQIEPVCYIISGCFWLIALCTSTTLLQFQMIYNQFASSLSSSIKIILTNSSNECAFFLSFPAVCQGITNRLNLLGSKADHYLNMVKTYSNCTVVLENLEVTHMEDHRDLSFLRVNTALC